MIQFDNETRSLLSDLLKSTGDLEDMFPRSGDEKISDPIKFALTLGEAIGVRKVCEQLGCKEDELLKSKMTCTEMTIAKGRGHFVGDSLSLVDEYINALEKTKNILSTLDCGKADYLLICESARDVAIEAYGVVRAVKSINSIDIRAIKELEHEISSTKEKVIEKLVLYGKTKNRGRKRANTNKRILDLLICSDRVLVDSKIRKLNFQSKSNGMILAKEFGYLSVAMIEKGYISRDLPFKELYHAFRNTFAHVGDITSFDYIYQAYKKFGIKRMTEHEGDKIITSHDIVRIEEIISLI